ncbi:MAG: hypothetical protein WBM09_12115 [Gallionella sp.]
MTKRKSLLRCAQPGCRVLTLSGLCDKHRTPPAEAPAQPDAQVARIDRLRADLEQIADAAARIDRRAERPIFGEQHE